MLLEALTDPEGIVIPRVGIGEDASPIPPQVLCPGSQANGEVTQRR